ncbi:MAG: tetratricopeptide repeat protein [Cyanobacteria bacterium P01_G01_bin.39]
MIIKQPDIQRQQTIRLAQDIRAAIRNPQGNPLLFNVYGKAGVGKSTLINKFTEIFSSEFQCAKISFGLNSQIKTVIDLMAAFDNQIESDISGWDVNTFRELHERYEEICQKLALEAAEGESSNSKEKIRESVKQFGKAALGSIFASTGAGALAASISTPLSNVTVDSAFYINDLLRKNKLTKNNLELQELVKNPIPKLAKAFVDTIIQKSQYKPILLVIDNHEKASWEFNTFLCQYILYNQELQNSPIRIVMAGELSLKNDRYKRMYRQYNSLISERQLEEFDFKEMTNYLSEIGINNTNDIRLYWNATKGYPYHLNLIRQQKEDGKQIHLSYGVNEMLKILLDGLNDTERKVVSLATYCRWFDQHTIEYLLEINNIQENPSEYSNWFKWLISRNFVIEDQYYYLDDVARNVILQVEHKSNKQKFRSIHNQLADYYQQQANIEIDKDDFYSEKYQCAEWCNYIIESNYHRLYANRKKGQIQLLNCFFEGVFLRNPDIAINSYLAINSEYDIDTNNFLPSDTKNFLTSISLAINFGWIILTENPHNYTFTLDDNGQSIKLQVEKSLSHCYQKSDYLDALPRIVSLISQVFRQNTNIDKISFLRKAKSQVEEIEGKQKPRVVAFILSYIGNIFVQLGMRAEALEIYQKAIDIDSSNANFLNNIGGCFYDADRYGEALDVLSKAIEIEPQNTIFLGNIGIVFNAQGKHDQALDSFEKALQIEPDNSINYMNHGWVLAGMKKYHRAIESFDKSLALDSSNPLAFINYSNTLFNLKQYSEALKMIDRAACIDSKDIDIWLRISNIFCNLECFDRAIEASDKALSIDCHNIDAWYTKGINQYYLHNFEQAIEIFNKTISKNPNQEIKVDCYNLTALCLSLLQKFDKSLQQIEIALEYNSDDNLLIANKGIILARQGNYSEAMACCELAINMNSNNENGYYAKACCYSLQNDKKQATENLAKAIEIAPLRCRLEAKVNPDFDHLRSNSEFQTLLVEKQFLNDKPLTTIVSIDSRNPL